MGTILAGTQEFWIGPWLGLASEPAGNRHVRSWPVRGKHGHDFDPDQMHADRASAWSAAW